MEKKSTWRKELNEALKMNGDKSEIIKVVPENLDLDKEFYDGYGLPEGEAFIIWTENYVYFPVTYDGLEWVESVPRNPTENVKPKHFGGW